MSFALRDLFSSLPVTAYCSGRFLLLLLTLVWMNFAE